MTALLSLPHGGALEAVLCFSRRVDRDDRVVRGLMFTVPYGVENLDVKSTTPVTRSTYGSDDV